MGQPLRGPREALSGAAFVRAYIDRVVNRGDAAAVGELVADDYAGSGHGWPADRPQLQAFYERQARERPRWRIDVQETIEVGEWVAVRALAGDADRRVEWLAAYRVTGGRIAEIRVLALEER